jgi:hypothetical protein
MIYVFDLDGTLCTQEKDYHRAKPLKKRILKVNVLYDMGHTIIIDTARGSETGIDHTKFTTLQLSHWGVNYHKLRCGHKMFGTLYVDDKGMSDKHFFGD